MKKKFITNNKLIAANISGKSLSLSNFVFLRTIKVLMILCCQTMVLLREMLKKKKNRLKKY